VDQNGVFDSRQDVEEVCPDFFLVIRPISPKAVVNNPLGGFDTNSDQVVKVPVRKPLDI
jgi:hypothetical protein